jgi:hypothetical protein
MVPIVQPKQIKEVKSVFPFISQCVLSMKREGKGVPFLPPFSISTPASKP